MTTPTAIILAAGRGSRMRELTDTKPKCLLELAGRPLLHWQLDALRDAGVERIVLVRGYAAHTLVGLARKVERLGNDVYLLAVARMEVRV